MKKLSLALLVVLCCCCVQLSTQQIQQSWPKTPNSRSCVVNQELLFEYRLSIYNFILPLYKAVAIRSNLNFVFSPNSVWLILAAIAEGADPVTQQQLFQLLNLPGDSCIRQAYYHVASTRMFPSKDVDIRSTRVLLTDYETTLSQAWYDLVATNSLLEVASAPIRYDTVATANIIENIMSSRFPRLNLSGNSVLLDTLDYNGMWKTAFSDAVIERAPFYSEQGEEIGAVDLMKVKRRVKMGYNEKLGIKIIELPIGSDERYKMLIGMKTGVLDLKTVVNEVNSEIVFEFIKGLRPTNGSIDVAIPRVVITSDIDMRTILEDLAVTDLWTYPTATRYISDPPAFPTSFVQRATLVLNNTGLEYARPETESAISTSSGVDVKDFIADRPFVIGLFDAETYTCLMAAAYTQPTYTN